MKEKFLACLHTRSFWILLLIFGIGILFRFSNISPYKFYPDAYYSLIVAENIRTYHSVLGFLGQDGMLYPDFFMWTRPGYPLLILFVSFFSKNTELAASSISFVSSVFSIPLAYVFIKRVLGKTSYALLGAALLAFSFNHTVWGGFIMTEGISVFLMLLFLLSLFSTMRKTTTLANVSDFTTGILLGLAILTRYEYAILLIPMSALILSISPKPLIRLINISSALLMLISLVISQLFPLHSLIEVIFFQLRDILSRGGLIGLLFLLLLSVWFLIPKRIKSNLLSPVCTLLVLSFWLFALFLTSQHVFHLDFARTELTFYRNFITSDMLLSLFFLIGISQVVFKKNLRASVLFFVFSALSLSLLYQRVNSEMDRYLTHIIPFLIIPSSYGLVLTLTKIQRMIRNKNHINQKIIGIIGAVSLLCLFAIQGYKTYTGLKNTGDRTWFQMSYEEKSARMTKKFTHNSALLIASFPEPYYLYTKVSTYRCSSFST